MVKSLRITEAARLLEVHPNTIRSAIKRHETGDDGGLKATLKPGKWGRPEYAINPTVFETWALTRFGRTVDASRVSSEVEARVAAALPESERDLYERLVKLTEEVTRYKALETVTGQTRVEELEARCERLAADNAELRTQLARRGWLRRLF